MHYAMVNLYPNKATTTSWIHFVMKKAFFEFVEE